MPNSLSVSWLYSVRPAMACRKASVSVACGHMACSSRGGPGSTTTVGPEPFSGGTTRPGAVPAGSITSAPSGTSACLRFAVRTASGSSSVKRFISGFRISAILPSRSSSRPSGRPVKPATTSIVMSSAVGPSPPLVITRSTPCSAMKRSCDSMSSGRSPVIVMCASSTPSSSRRSASQGPLRSATRPVRTSVPVTTMPARAAIQAQGLWPTGSALRPFGVNSKPAGFGPGSSGTALPFTRSFTEVLPRFTRRRLPLKVREPSSVPW